MSFDINPLDDNPDPHVECRHEIQRLQGFEAAYRIWDEKTRWVHDKTGWEFPVVGMHCADVMTKEINRLTVRLAEARHLLDMAMCDPFVLAYARSSLVCDIKDFLAAGKLAS